MVLKKVTFRLKEKQKKDFKGKCESEGKSMYSILQWLTDKYIKNELTQNPSTAKIEILQKQTEEKEIHYQRLIKEKDSQIEELKKTKNLFNMQSEENLVLMKHICNFVLEVNAHRSVKPLSDAETNFCFRFANRE